MDTYYFFAVLLGLIGPSLCEYCTEHNVSANGYNSRTVHCSFGCCGDYYDQYCCVSSTGFIVGLVFAGIFTISVVIAVVCCCIKHKGQRGRIIQPGTTTLTAPQHGTQNVFIVPSNGPQPPPYAQGGNTMMYHAPPAYHPAQGGYAYSAAMPPPYASSGVQPPAYSVEGPKYHPQPAQNPFAAAAGTGNQ